MSASAHLSSKDISRLSENALNIIPYAVFVVDIQANKIILCNQATETIFGYQQGEMLEAPLKLLFVNSNQFDHFTEMSKLEYTQKKVFQTKFELRKQDGESFWAEYTVIPMDGEGGNSENILHTVRDISQEQSVKETIRLHASFVDALGEAVVATDLNGIIMFWNAAAEKMFGWVKDESLGIPIHLRTPSDQLDEYGQIARKKLEKGENWRAEMVLQRRDGTSFPALVTNSPIMNDDGVLIGIIGIALDISEIKAQQESLKISQTSLQKINTLFDGFMQHLPTPVVVVNRDNRILLTNQAWELATGISQEDAVHSLLNEIMPEDRVESSIAENMLVLDSMQVLDVIKEGKFRDEISTWHVIKFPLFLVDQGTYGVGEIRMDITERQRAKQMLQESEQKYRAFVETSHDIIWETNTQGNLTFINQAVTSVLGYTPDSLLGENWNDIRLDVEAETWDILSGSIADGHEYPQHALSRVLHQDGRSIYLQTNAMKKYDAHGIYLGERGTSQDVTERYLFQRSLIQSREALRSLSKQILQVQENERRAIAVELHDRIGQSLTILKLRQKILEKKIPSISLELIERINENITLIDEILKLVRDLSIELRPSMLDDLGLSETLKWYFKKIGSSTGINVQINDRMHGKLLPEGIGITFYRIIQEATTNILRHAEASKIVVTLIEHPDRIQVILEDNGKGFDLKEKLRGSRNGQSLGLIGMQERAELVSCECHIETKKGSGTSITLTYFLPTQEVE